MRKIRITIKAFLVLAYIFLNIGCSSNEGLKLTTIRIEDPVRKYFPILQGQRQKINVKVYNTGDEPLKIYDVFTSCGCTIAKFPKGLIPAGEYGTIDMEYNSNKNIGYAGIYTIVKANTKKGTEEFFFEINVVPDPHYTKDYEELYNEDKEDGKSGVKDLVDGKTNQQGYTTDTTQIRKFK